MTLSPFAVPTSRPQDVANAVAQRCPAASLASLSLLYLFVAIWGGVKGLGESPVAR
ncbi:acidic endochitinase SE2-like [Pyrus ussuriensis x Pyrus communis]|uniref:Acidic endochitinase SE2-like n=1 Tax=Pyrus ussuriensis x Pyrus communis TaxID=2448454 RepID=A0A5N5G2P3_9ROSA|nr:acidic endochitinase SE2-like [Pyrus ussuriensis x Pyrus communis]